MPKPVHQQKVKTMSGVQREAVAQAAPVVRQTKKKKAGRIIDAGKVDIVTSSGVQQDPDA